MNQLATNVKPRYNYQEPVSGYSYHKNKRLGKLKKLKNKIINAISKKSLSLFKWESVLQIWELIVLNWKEIWALEIPETIEDTISKLSNRVYNSLYPWRDIIDLDSYTLAFPELEDINKLKWLDHIIASLIFSLKRELTYLWKVIFYLSGDDIIRIWEKIIEIWINLHYLELYQESNGEFTEHTILQFQWSF